MFPHLEIVDRKRFQISMNIGYPENKRWRTDKKKLDL
jgi:hypothetical protein